MDVEVTRLPESRVALKIELSPGEVDQALERTYKQLVQRVTIPGFRKGKAPRAVLERMVGPEWFLHEATEEAIRWGYRTAIDQEHIVPIDEATIDADEHDSHAAHLAPGEPFHFEATVSVRPQVPLPDYHTIHIERKQIDVTDEDVDEVLSEIRQRQAMLEPTIRPAQIGDVLSMNVVAKVEGEDVIQNENADFELRDEENGEPDPVLPGLAVELVGASPGDIREPVLSLPELYPNQDLAGKSMFLRILIKEVKRKVLPDADDEFAQTVSSYQTLDELKDALRSNIELERRLQADEQLVGEAIREVISRTFLEIPPTLIEEEQERMLGDIRDEFQRRHLDFQLYLDTTNRSEDDVRNEMREDAINNVKTSLVLSAVADQEGITVSNQEINAALEEIFRQTSTSDSERRRLRSSSNVRANIRSRIRRQRAIQKLVAVMSGGDEVSSEAAEAMADQTAGTAEDAQETVAVEAAG